uniref:Uncharacterized protein n=1 Tax=Mycena chlorophos TaxID=658473 RepID=A0ABQ0LPC8_MYCCL|nr:predicted protein [Mycena chlorophos]
MLSYTASPTARTLLRSSTPQAWPSALIPPWRRDWDSEDSGTRESGRAYGGVQWHQVARGIEPNLANRLGLRNHPLLAHVASPPRRLVPRYPRLNNVERTHTHTTSRKGQLHQRCARRARPFQAAPTGRACSSVERILAYRLPLPTQPSQQCDVATAERAPTLSPIVARQRMSYGEGLYPAPPRAVARLPDVLPYSSERRRRASWLAAIPETLQDVSPGPERRGWQPPFSEPSRHTTTSEAHTFDFSSDSFSHANAGCAGWWKPFLLVCRPLDRDLRTRRAHGVSPLARTTRDLSRPTADN